MHIVYPLTILSTNADEQKKEFQIFGIDKKITVVGKYFPSLKLQHFFTDNISKNRHMKL